MDTLTFAQLQKLVNNLLQNPPKKDNYYHNIAYKTSGPLVLGYTLWTLALSNQNLEEAVYFLARDGYLPYQTALQLRPFLLNENLPRLYYLTASRRMITLPGYSYIAPQKILDYLTIDKPGYTLKNYLERLNLDIPLKELTPILNKHKLNLNTVIATKQDYQKLKAFFNDLLPTIQKQLKQEIPLIIKYLKNNNLDKYSNLAIVDLGWSGNMQIVLNKYIKEFNPKAQTTYYFFALKNITKLQKLLKANIKTYVDNEHSKDIFRSIELIENLITAPETTAIKLTKQKDSIQTIYAQNEPKDLTTIKKQLIQGNIDFTHDFVLQLKKHNLNIDLKELYTSLTIPANRMWFLKNYLKLAKRPNQKDAYYLGKIKHSQGIGNTTTWNTIAFPSTHISKKDFYNPRRLFYKLKLLTQEFSSCHWKIAYLKNLKWYEKPFVLMLFVPRYIQNKLSSL